MASFSADSFDVNSFDINSFDLDDVHAGSSTDGTSGGRGGGGGRLISSGPAYYPSRDRKLLEEIARVEAEIRRKEAEEKALVAKQRYDTVGDLRRIAARLVDLEILRSKLRAMAQEVEQREYLEAVEAYEAYQRRKLH